MVKYSGFYMFGKFCNNQHEHIGRFKSQVQCDIYPCKVNT